MAGSSPRVWGTLSDLSYAAHYDRFIPTCVGNISTSDEGYVLPAVHPHVCGEHLLYDICDDRNCGSSPRVWGTFIEALLEVREDRFIPTCVGNISGPSRKSGKRAVHPHVCGEHFIVERINPLTYGSSPRVWGTYWQPEPHSKGVRFIPTCVGNIIISSWDKVPAPVHPHVCGEHVIVKATSTTNSVHPHVCGEHARAYFSAVTNDGSSPRVWGTSEMRSMGRVKWRFIPTCVGNITARKHQ